MGLEARGVLARVVSMGAIATGLVGVACDDGPPLITPNPSGNPGVGGASSTSSAGGEGGRASSSSSAGGEAPSYPVRLGLRANPAADAALGVGDDPATLAELQSLAAGVRTVMLEVPFDTFDADVLDAEVRRYAERDVSVVLQLLVVDRKADHNPFPGFAWTASAVSTALSNAVSGITSAGTDTDATEPAVQAVVLGREVGVYVDTHPDEAAALSSFLASGVVALQTEGIPVGIGLGFRGDADANLVALAGQGDRLTMSYFPGLDSQPTQGTTPGQDLDAIIALAAGRPVMLTAVGFTSAGTLGADGDQQRQRLNAFFSALQPRRGDIPTVVVHQLHDESDEGCDALVTSRGETPDGDYARFVCSSGLRTSDDMAKPAWDRFLEAAAVLSSP